MTTHLPGLEKLEDGYPLAPIQEGMLFHTVADPDSRVFANQTHVDILGNLDPEVFKTAWDGLITRHSALRTAFLWDGLDEPLQVVHRRAPLEWAEQDLSTLSVQERASQLEEILGEDRMRAFDLSRAPLMRMSLIRMGEQEWRWIWSCHHLIADGWSVQVLLDELRVLYREAIGRGPAELPEPPAYRDFIAHLLSRDKEADESFWRQRLAGFSTPHRLEIPGLPPDPEADGHRSHTIELGESATSALRATSASERVTLNTSVVGAWALLLSRWSGEHDVVFGATTSGREADIQGIERGVGLFINTLPVRLEVSPARTLGDWLRDVQRHQLEMREFERSSLADVQRWSDVAAGEALFESIFVFENQPTPAETPGDDWHYGQSEFIEHSNYPLALLVVPGESLSVKFVYDTARFAPAAIESLGRQMLMVLNQFADGAAGPLSGVELVEPDERARLQDLGRGPTTEEDDRCIHELIEEVGARQPEAIAVAFDGESLSYGDLNDRADELANRLRATGVGPNRLVGLYVNRSFNMIVGILAILKAGGAYVPLDPSYPAGHIAGLLEDGGIDIVVTNGAVSADVETSATLVIIDDAAESPAPHPSADVEPADLAYVIHTSGSTGGSKGVMVSHRNLVASNGARARHYGKPVNRFLLLSSFAFDSSVVGIFWTLTSGGTLVLPTPGMEHDIDGLVALAAHHEVTHLLSLPAVYRLLLKNAAAGELNALKVAIVAGEACPPGILESHELRVPDAELHNEYGPTETTVWCTVHQASAADRGRPLPIGKPIAGSSLRVLDRLGNLVPEGFAGELWVAGSGVARGYLNRPDLTAERFVSNDGGGSTERSYGTGDLVCFRQDGSLLFLGRADQQLKIRGYRIEVGSVEAALRAQPGVHDAAAAGRSAMGGSATQLVGYIQASESAIDVSEIRRRLLASLPEFLVPDVLVRLDELPRLPNGKIDYGNLPETAVATSSGFVAPRNPAEAALAAIWSDLLGIESVSVVDDFFALGGDSIVSIQMISRARREGLHLQPGQITAYPTIEGLAAIGEDPGVTRPDAEPVNGMVPLGPIQRWFFESGLNATNHWNQSGLFEVPGDIDTGLLESALQACLDHHDMLRAQFTNQDGQWRQTVEMERKLPLEVLDVGDGDIAGPIAHAQAGLDIEQGPLVRALLLQRPKHPTNLLFLAVHHLVVDVVSWLVLIEDIEAAYRRLAEGSEIALPPRTTSYRDWVQFLATQDRSAERAHWLGSVSETVLPVKHSGDNRGCESDAASVAVSLDQAASRLLVSGIHDAYQTRPEEVLVAALGRTLAGWTGSNSVSVVLEGHGRPDAIDGVDLSRTVGWFTDQYPVYLDAGSPDPGDLIKGAKEAIRSTPAGGIGFGALRHLDRDEELLQLPDPPVLFNYVSRVFAPTDGALLTWVSGEQPSARNPQSRRPFPIEVVASIRSDELTVEWHYSKTLHDEDTIRGLATSYLDCLSDLIEHCMASGSGGFTPHDFPEAGLTQDELDTFLDGLA